MSSLAEALQASGVVEKMDNLKREVIEERKARNEKLLPHQRWWQNFRLSVTPFEIKVFIKVQCEQWTEGLDVIGKRNLNKITTRCRTQEEAVEQVRAKIVTWQAENVIQPDVEPPFGSLLYWRIYD